MEQNLSFDVSFGRVPLVSLRNDGEKKLKEKCCVRETFHYQGGSRVEQGSRDDDHNGWIW